MVGDVPIDAVGVGSGWVLVGFFVVLVLRGYLVPRRTYEDSLHDRDEWRAAHRISETARVKNDEQLTQLLEHARVTEAVLRALPHSDDERS